jgi:hypothetical protein
VLCERTFETAVAETERRIQDGISTISDVYRQMARSTLLPVEMSATILAGDLPPAGDVVNALVISSLDCEATVSGDPQSSLNEKRIARACLTIAFLTALSSFEHKQASSGE